MASSDLITSVRSTLLAILLVWPAAQGLAANPAAPEADHQVAGNAPVIRDPFVAYAWSSAKDAHFSNIVPFYWLKAENPDPRRAKAATDRQPVGHRAIFSWDLHKAISGHPLDACRNADGSLSKTSGIWWDHGVAEVRTKFEAFFAGYKRIGGELDVFVLDFEGGMSNWHLGNDSAKYDAIAADPRFPKVAAQLGFADLTTVRNWSSQKGNAAQHYLIWNALMEERVAQYVNEAIYAPLKQYFPDAICSNYGAHHHSPHLEVRDINGHRVYAHGMGAHVGSHQALPLYGELGNVKHLRLDGEQKYTRSAFNAMRFSLNQLLSAALSCDVPVMPWIACANYKNSLLRGNDFYKELVFHCVLAGADDFLYWNPRPWSEEQDPSHFADRNQDQLLNDLLVEAGQLVGYSDRSTLENTIVPWNSKYVLSGMAANGRSVWRFTPAPGSKVQMEADKALFIVHGLRIEIPGGRIYRPQTKLSKFGRWVIAPIDARPRVAVANLHQGDEGNHSD